jgi:hypothetical protein
LSESDKPPKKINLGQEFLSGFHKHEFRNSLLLQKNEGEYKLTEISKVSLYT